MIYWDSVKRIAQSQMKQVYSSNDQKPGRPIPGSAVPCMVDTMVLGITGSAIAGAYEYSKRGSEEFIFPVNSTPHSTERMRNLKIGISVHVPMWVCGCLCLPMCVHACLCSCDCVF